MTTEIVDVGQLVENMKSVVVYLELTGDVDE